MSHIQGLSAAVRVSECTVKTVVRRSLLFCHNVHSFGQKSKHCGKKGVNVSLQFLQCGKEELAVGRSLLSININRYA